MALEAVGGKVEWRIYYSNGSTFSNLEGRWEDAPKRGVVCVVTLDPTGACGRFVLHNHEYYYKTPNREVMCGEILENIKVHVPDILDDEIKMGGNAWQEDWQAIQSRAFRDPDFPRRSPKRRASDWADRTDPRAPVHSHRDPRNKPQS